MTKQEALNALTEVITEKWEDAKKSFQRSKSSATSDEVRQESKYDTRGLEESYLAHGLAKAVQDYEMALSHLNEVKLSPSTEQVSLGSFIQCRSGSGEILSFLLSSSGGGIEAEVSEESVTIITPESPLAQSLLGKEKGDPLSTPPFKILKVS